MTPEELLQRYPRETLRWLRGRLGLSQPAFGIRVGVRPATPRHWEARRKAIGRASRAQIAALLAPHLATEEGRAFVRSLGRGEAVGGA